MIDAQSARDAITKEREAILDELFRRKFKLESDAMNMSRIGGVTSISELIRTEQAMGLQRAIEVIQGRIEGDRAAAT